MTTRKKTNEHEIPIITDLEAENTITRIKGKDREKLTLSGLAAENKDRHPKSKG